MSRPKWAENVSVEDALVGLFATNEGDEAILREGFAWIKRADEAYSAGRLAGFEEGTADLDAVWDRGYAAGRASTRKPRVGAR